MIDRELLRCLVRPFGLSVVGLVGLVVLFQLQRWVQSVLGTGLRGSDVLVILGAMLPSVLVLALPLAVLTAVLVGLGRLSAGGELQLLETSGASPLRVARVPLGFALSVSLAGIGVAHFGAPPGMRVAQRRVSQVVLRNLSLGVQPGRLLEHAGWTIAVEERSDERLRGVLMVDHREPQREVVVAAAGGRSLTKLGQWTLQLNDGEIRALGSPGMRLRFREARVGLDPGRTVRERTDWIGKLPQTSSSDLLRGHGARDRVEARRMTRDFWRRTTMPLTALSFAVVGIVLVYRWGPDRLLRATIGGVLSVLMYYVLGRGVDDAVNRTEFPVSVLVALPNLGLLIIAAWVARGGLR